MSFRLSLNPLQLQPPPVHLPPDGSARPRRLKLPPVPQASSDPGSAWSDSSSRRRTARPPIGRSGSGRGTPRVWSGSSVGCRARAESCLGLQQIPFRKRGQRWLAVCKVLSEKLPSLLLNPRPALNILPANISRLFYEAFQRTTGSLNRKLLHWWHVFYEHTLNTWNASNWMFRLLSLSRFIISFKFSARLMYLVMTVKLCLSSRSSPRSWKTVFYYNHVVIVMPWVTMSVMLESKRKSDSDEQWSFYLQRLSLGDVVLRMQELLVFCEHLKRHFTSILIRTKEVLCWL